MAQKLDNQESKYIYKYLVNKYIQENKNLSYEETDHKLEEIKSEFEKQKYVLNLLFFNGKMRLKIGGGLCLTYYGYMWLKKYYENYTIHLAKENTHFKNEYYLYLSRYFKYPYYCPTMFYSKAKNEIIAFSRLDVFELKLYGSNIDKWTKNKKLIYKKNIEEKNEI